MQFAEQNANVRTECMVLKDPSIDEQTRLEAERREKAWRDEMDRLDGAKNAGIGREQRDQENVTNMYADGLSPEQIARYLRINLSTVTKILNLQ